MNIKGRAKLNIINKKNVILLPIIVALLNICLLYCLYLLNIKGVIVVFIFVLTYHNDNVYSSVYLFVTRYLIIKSKAKKKQKYLKKSRINIQPCIPFD